MKRRNLHDNPVILSGKKSIEYYKTKKINKRVLGDKMNTEIEKIEGYTKLSIGQKNRFTSLLTRFLNAQGTDMRNNLSIKSVSPVKGDFRIDTIRYGVSGFQVLTAGGSWY